jgi:hypothetical protein
MFMLIISDRWKNKSVCIRLFRYMRDTFLELETMLNDELIHREINDFVSLHIVRVSNKNTLCSLWIKCLPLLRGNPGPCTRTEYKEVGHFRFEAALSLKGGFILDICMVRYVLDVGFIIKCFSP